MKRVVAMAVFTMLVLALALAAFGDSYTEISYTLNSTQYQISVPPAVQLGDQNSVLEIKVTENHSENDVNVTITGSNSNSAGWFLKSSSGDMIGFDLSLSGHPIVPGGTISVGIGGAFLNVELNENDLRYALNGTYRERLTFRIN